MNPFDEAIGHMFDEAAQSLVEEATLEPALETISQMAYIEDSRHILEAAMEQLTMADGSIVESMEAEVSYKAWRDDNWDFVKGTAATGLPLVQELRATLEAIHKPSMESDLLRSLKRTYQSMEMGLKTFGKSLVDIKSNISKDKDKIKADPALITMPRSYGFLTRDNKPVMDLSVSIAQDIKFIDACEEHYKNLFDKSVELGKAFRSATSSDSNSDIRDAIDQFDAELLDRTEFMNLTKFNLLGNRKVYLDKRGYPKFKRGKVQWNLSKKPTSEDGAVSKLIKGSIHGYSIGGAVKNISKVSDEDTAKVAKKVKSSGGETDLEEFMKVVDRAILLNNRAVKFAQMAASMGERVQRLSADLDDAYNDVNSEKSIEENTSRVRELRALHKSARRSVSQYMFLGKSIAIMMEDHATYVYRNVAVLANEVLNQTKGRKSDE